MSFDFKQKRLSVAAISIDDSCNLEKSGPKTNLKANTDDVIAFTVLNDSKSTARTLILTFVNRKTGYTVHPIQWDSNFGVIESTGVSIPPMQLLSFTGLVSVIVNHPDDGKIKYTVTIVGCDEDDPDLDVTPPGTPLMKHAKHGIRTSTPATKNESPKKRGGGKRKKR